MALAVHAAALAVSVGLHLGVAAPWLAWRELTYDLDSPGDEGPGGPTGNDGGELLAPGVPVNVSIYTPPKATPRPAAPSPSAAAAPAASAAGDSQGAVTGGGGGPPEAGPSDYVADQRTLREGSQGKPPRGKKKPCEPIDEIVQNSPTKWTVERDLLDWYSTHLRELEKQAGVSSHRGEDGKRDGARLYLPRCSILKQAGFKNGDVVHRVNGKKVNTIPQGVATWLAVRNDKTLTVELSRRSGEQLVHRYRLK